MSDEDSPASAGSGDGPRTYPPGTWRVGSVRGVDVLVRSSWLLVALLIAVVLAPRIEEVEPGLGVLKYVAGVAFAVLFYLSLLLHEISHALMAQRYGLGVRSISLVFLGGFTEIDSETRTPGQEFKVAVVGPLTSIVVGLAFIPLWLVSPDGLIKFTLGGLAFSNIVVGAYNLIPGLPFDGGHVLKAFVWRITGNVHRGTIVAAWGGRFAAALVLFWPWVAREFFDLQTNITDYVLAVVIAAFLWSGATASMVSARVRRRLPSLKARPLARRVIAVPDDLPVSEAVRRAQEAGAGAIVVHVGDDRLSGIVSETALLATPEDRRAWVPVSSLARSIEDGLLLPADIVGEDLVRAMSATPAEEYVLVEGDGSILGVLATSDVDRAFEEGARK
ncbi:site-2 protease family protein [Marmoricola sp. URHB0036]|uniref:site-2 protease family protein n=1 Tax=Marmoricola sp. URHB0036 TaxID=1298863 RepID=UPI00055B3224|nr:site-2 protease family protein [Marmoricola sp. URHB0036]